MTQFKNKNGISISYVIRDDTERAGAVAAGGFTAQLYDAPMVGPTFLQDNFRVELPKHMLIRSNLLNTAKMFGLPSSEPMKELTRETPTYKMEKIAGSVAV